MPEVLWEEKVPMLRDGIHKKLRDKAYGDVSHGERVYPLVENVFGAMKATPFLKTKVVIIGQDPYFNAHPQGPEAHGLCFSVQKGIPTPPSLRNILKEVNESIYGGEQVSCETDLTRWAEQGVLLLNASLSVIAKKPNSHAKIGWHELTDNIIETISKEREQVVFMLWGAFAQKKTKLIDTTKHCIIKTSHPSPLSVYRGFAGSGVFVQCNDYLEKTGQETITW